MEKPPSRTMVRIIELLRDGPRDRAEIAGALKLRENVAASVLTAMEYRVLEYLVHRPRAVVSKTELLEHLYDYNWEKFSNVIEVYISGLRRKLNEGASRQLIRTLRGQGYMLQD